MSLSHSTATFLISFACISATSFAADEPPKPPIHCEVGDARSLEDALEHAVQAVEQPKPEEKPSLFSRAKNYVSKKTASLRPPIPPKIAPEIFPPGTQFGKYGTYVDISPGTEGNWRDRQGNWWKITRKADGAYRETPLPPDTAPTGRILMHYTGPPHLEPGQRWRIGNEPELHRYLITKQADGSMSLIRQSGWKGVVGGEEATEGKVLIGKDGVYWVELDLPGIPTPRYMQLSKVVEDKPIYELPDARYLFGVNEPLSVRAKKIDLPPYNPTSLPPGTGGQSGLRVVQGGTKAPGPSISPTKKPSLQVIRGGAAKPMPNRYYIRADGRIFEARPGESERMLSTGRVEKDHRGNYWLYEMNMTPLPLSEVQEDTDFIVLKEGQQPLTREMQDIPSDYEVIRPKKMPPGTKPPGPLGPLRPVK